MRPAFARVLAAALLLVGTSARALAPTRAVGPLRVRASVSSTKGIHAVRFVLPAAVLEVEGAQWSLDAPGQETLRGTLLGVDSRSDVGVIQEGAAEFPEFVAWMRAQIETLVDGPFTVQAAGGSSQFHAQARGRRVLAKHAFWLIGETPQQGIAPEIFSASVQLRHEARAAK